MADELPKNMRGIKQEERFRFSCHPAVPCFTECCRQLDLNLAPYDLLRLKNRLGMKSDAFLDRYVIIEWDEQLVFPQCYLTMVDDGRASCVFVSPEGCTVYEDRPGACRAYPVGRGASRRHDGRILEHLVLVREPHCLGFDAANSRNAGEYFQNQGLTEYNRFNDEVLRILQHERVRQGFKPTRRQMDQFILALYNLDIFRQEMNAGRIVMNRPLSTVELQGLTGDDEKLLLLGVAWLIQELFNE